MLKFGGVRVCDRFHFCVISVLFFWVCGCVNFVNLLFVVFCLILTIVFLVMFVRFLFFLMKCTFCNLKLWFWKFELCNICNCELLFFWNLESLNSEILNVVVWRFGILNSCLFYVVLFMLDYYIYLFILSKQTHIHQNNKKQNLKCWIVETWRTHMFCRRLEYWHNK